MELVAEIVHHFGGPAALARRLQVETGKPVSTQVVFAWRKSGSLPRWWLASVAKLMEDEGRPLTAEQIIELGSKPRESRTAPPAAEPGRAA